MSSFPHLSLLSLNCDVLTMIVQLLSVQDAREFRLCSRRTDALASTHAFSELTLRIRTWEPTNVRANRLLRILNQEAGRLSLIRHLQVLWESKTYVDRELAILIFKLLSRTSGVRELKMDACESILEHCPHLLNTLADFPHLKTLVLRESDNKISDWFLIGGNIPTGSPLMANLTRLSLTQLDFTRLGAHDLLQFNALRSLSVETIRGDIECCVKFAPLLEKLKIRAYHNNILPFQPTGRGWKTLTAVVGSVTVIRHLLPLFRKTIHRVVLTDDIKSENVLEHLQLVLQALKPYCLEFKGRLDGGLVFRHLTREQQHFVYLRLCALEADEPSFNELHKYIKQFNSLVCFDFDMRRASATPWTLAQQVHYLSCKAPKLRLMLTHMNPRSELSQSHQKAPRLSEAIGDTIHGIVFTNEAHQALDWQTGRTVATLSRAVARQARNAYRDPYHRLDLDEHFFHPGSVPTEAKMLGYMGLSGKVFMLPSL